MKQSILTTSLLLMILVLSSCGGGGSGSVDPRPNDNLILTVTSIEATLPANTLGWPPFDGSPFQTQVNVRVTYANGQGVATGLITHMQTNNSSIAYVGIPDDPSTEDINEFAQGYVGVNQETIGANASYYIRSDSTSGNMSFTISATHPETGRNFEKVLNFTITQGPDQTVQKLVAVPTRTTMPPNIDGTEYFSGTPFMIEADIQVRDVFGNLTEPGLAGTTSGSVGRPVVKVSVNPTNILYTTKLDDANTITINEFLTEISPTEININAGHGNLFLWSRNEIGTAIVTLSTIEAGSGFEISNSFQVEVVTGVDDGLPTDIALEQDSGAMYTSGSGGDSTHGLHYTVTSGDFPVLDPQVNNVQISLITDGPASGEFLNATNISGSNVQGTTINIATVDGFANAIINSGSNPNTITLTSTVDGADNNVDNGIQQPIAITNTFVVSDGVLWELDISFPQMQTLAVHGDHNSDGSISFLDGTYSIVVSAIGTDKAGNPALPQTLQFGMINSPITGYPDNGSGSFLHSALDGNPQEGGSGFTSVSGRFLTTAGGVQPADTLVVFGEHSLGNEDLESAVTVASINSETSITIVEKFNRNDSTGSIDNNFGVLPYAIGRAVDGNITATAVMNELGVATTRLNYPISQLGKIAALYVKGQGAITNSVAKSVVDVSTVSFPGSLDYNDQQMTLVVSPNVIPANVNNIQFAVCLRDAARSPLPGRQVTFAYVGGTGQGIIDGQTGTGVMDQYTSYNGCTTGVVSTIGVLPGGNTNNLGFNFFAGGGELTCTRNLGDDTPCMEVISSSSGVLNANPSAFIGRGTVNITLTLYDASGNPIQGAAISGACDQVNGGALGIVSGPSVTDSNGHSSVTVSVSLDAPDGGLSSSCDFATASGSPSVTVNFTGGDSCALGGVTPSPAPPADACTPDP